MGFILYFYPKMVKGEAASYEKRVNQYYVVGRRLPTEDCPAPTLYRIRVFGRDEVLARSKFWYHMKRQHKIRRIQGEIVSTSQIFEKRTGVMRNYGIFLRYDARTTTVNMYKEFRDTSLCGAVSQLYMEMSGRHSGRGETIQIIKTAIVADADARREKTQQFAKGGVVFPKTRTVKRAPVKPCRPCSRLTDPPSSEYITVLLLTLISKMLEARCAAPLPVHLDLLCPNKMPFCLNPN